MELTAFYNRRREITSVGSDRRLHQRRIETVSVAHERRRLASQIRRYEREAIHLPVRLSIRNREFSGDTLNISPAGLLMLSAADLAVGTPLGLRFSFVDNGCFLVIEGEVVFCLSSKTGERNGRETGIKFGGIGAFQQKLLASAVREFGQSAVARETSFLDIRVRPDTQHHEAAETSVQTGQTLWRGRDATHSMSGSSIAGAASCSGSGAISPRGVPGVGFDLSEEQKGLQETVRRFAQKEIIPVAAHHDRSGEFPWKVLKKAFDLGIFTCYVPQQFGGGGLGILETAIITEELAAGCVGMATSIMVNVLGLSPLLLAGTAEQKERFLLPYCRQLTLFSFCFTEPDAGSDPSRIATTATHDGDYYILNGSKCFITNGGVADYLTIFATLDKNLGTKGLTAFLMPANAKGIRVGKALDKMGQRAANTAELFFEDVKIPKENRIGEEGEGYKIAMLSISKSRINVAAGAVGVARTAMEHALRHAQKRVQFGHPLAGFQYVQFRLADMARDTDAARLLALRAAWKHDQGQRYAKESSMAKDFAGDVVMKVTSAALDLLGGYGYSKEYPMEKLMRDAKLMQIYEGPSPIHKHIVYREVAKELGF